MSGTYRILAIDGGGIRGIIPARILEEIEGRCGTPISQSFDLLAGTSTGGIIALGLAKPNAQGTPAYSARDMLKLYQDDGETIFPSSLLLKVRTLGGLADVRYPAQPLEDLLNDRFGDTQLSQALTEVVIPSYDLSAPGPFFFKREYAKDGTHTWDVAMAKVARATSAAPTYFDPARLPAFENEGDHALVDGGTFSNNPALAALVDGLRLREEEQDILVVSIGTGHPPDTPGKGAIPVAADAADGWGLARWARPILEVVLDGAAKAVEYQLAQMSLAGDSPVRCFRLQSSIPTASHALDDATEENRTKLLADANSLIDSEMAKIDAICAALDEA